MTNLKKKKRSPFKQIGKLVIILILFSHIIFRVTSFFSQAVDKIHITEYGKIETVIVTEGFIIRDEEILKEVDKEKMSLLIDEGSRVRKGQEIGIIHYDNVEEGLHKDLEIINLRIDNIRDRGTNSEIFKKDINKLQDEIDMIINKIHYYIREGEFDKIALQKKELSLLNEKRNIIEGERSFGHQKLEQLQRQQNNLQEKIDYATKTIYSPEAGFLLLGKDGLEDLLSGDKLQGISLKEYNNIKTMLLEADQNTEEEKIALKLVKSYKWHIVTRLEDGIEGFQEEKQIRIRPRTEEEEYDGFIKKIIQDEDKGTIIIIEMAELIDNWYNERDLSFDIIMDSHEGVMLPNEAIIEQEGQAGVLRLDVNGYCRFVPVKIKGQDKESSIVYNAYFQDGDIKVNTINYYDEIVKNPSKVEEGDKIR